MEQRFFICEHCGNIIAVVKASGVPVVCCGENRRSWNSQPKSLNK